jgi:molybdenum cofactor cytidylyltransferase
MNKIGIIILAAGDSSRLGRPKQLLPYRGKTLLAHIVGEALDAALDPLVVVTGAFEAEVGESLRLSGLAVEMVYNPRWEEGMASGIVAGLERLVALRPGADARADAAVKADAIIIAVCDQPYVSADLLRRLVESYHASAKGIIACGYSGAVGTPVLFSRQYFPELSALSGKEGAKQLLKRYPDDMVTISFPQGDIDIDTEEDFARINAFK